jgi:hypothetical protein
MCEHDEEDHPEACLEMVRVKTDVERYIRGYAEQPETEDEVAIAERPATEAAGWDPGP